MKAIQQLTSMVGKDEYMTKSKSANLWSIMIDLEVWLLSLCRLSLGHVLDVLKIIGSKHIY